MGLNVNTTFGYITNFVRKQHGLDKSHINDAFVIGNNLKARRLDVFFKGASFKRHYRKLYEAQPRRNMFYWHKRKDGTYKKINKKGKNKNKKYGLLSNGNFIPKPRRVVGGISLIFGVGLRDIVKYNNKFWYVIGRHSRGYFEIKNFNTGLKLPRMVKPNMIKIIQRNKPLMITEICERY